MSRMSEQDFLSKLMIMRDARDMMRDVNAAIVKLRADNDDETQEKFLVLSFSVEWATLCSVSAFL